MGFLLTTEVEEEEEKLTKIVALLVTHTLLRPIYIVVYTQNGRNDARASLPTFSYVHLFKKEMLFIIASIASVDEWT
jgi:hypothetical protein